MNAMSSFRLASAKVAERPAVLERLSPTWMKQQNAPPTVAETAIKPRPRIAVYLRYSSDKQDPYSFERQLDKARAYADLIGGDIVVVFGDPGESGAFKANRPEFKAMLKAARRREFDIVLIEEGDRLSRRLHITTSAFAELAEAGVELHSSKAGRWSLMHAAFQGLMSEEQRSRFSELSRSGIIKIVNRGLWPGRAPYGFKKIPHSPGDMALVTGEVGPGEPPEPDEVSVIIRAFKMRRQGLGPQQIADLFNHEGIPRRSGKPWYFDAVQRLLRNPIYIGALLYGRTHATRTEVDDEIKWNREKRPMNEWIYSERPEWAIIGIDLWNEVQKINLEHSSVTGPNSTYLLSRLVFCGACGGAMHASGERRHQIKLECKTNWKIKARKLDVPPCGAPHVVMESVEEAVIQMVCEQFDRPDAFERMQAGYSARVAKEAEGMNAKRRKLEQERSSLREKLDRTYDAASVMGMSTKVVSEQRVAYCARIDGIDDELASVPAVAIVEDVFKDAPGDSVAFLGEFVPGMNYKGCDESVAVLRVAFRRLVGRIVVSTDGTPNLNRKLKKATVEIRGPIADVEGEPLVREIVQASNNSVRIVLGHKMAREGKCSLSKVEWEYLRQALPADMVWNEDFDEPVSIRTVLEAVIFLKSTSLGPPNLPEDVFGPRSRLWPVARSLSYAGVFDLVQQRAIEGDIGRLTNIQLAVDQQRSRRPDSVQKFFEWNERRRIVVQSKIKEVSGSDD